MSTNKTAKISKYLKALSWVLVFLWMGLIFMFSAQESGESAQLSSGWLEMIKRLFSVELSHLTVRKLAHATEYFVLAFLLSNSLYLSHRKLSFLLPLIVSALYALTDEIHQYFVPGRACSFWDLLIDCSGALAGLLAYYAVFKISKYISARKSLK